MKPVSGLIVFVSAVLTLGETAEAATLYTPPMARPSVGELDCRLVNVGSAPLDITAELIDSNTGMIVAAQTCIDLPPGEHCSVGLVPGPDLGHCKFTVTSESGTVSANAPATPAPLSAFVRAAISSEGSEVHAALPAY